MELKIVEGVDDPTILKLVPRDAPEDGVYPAVCIIQGRTRRQFAEHIVRAVSSHADLLEACEDALNIINGMRPDSIYGDKEVARSILMTVIEKATKED